MVEHRADVRGGTVLHLSCRFVEDRLAREGADFVEGAAIEQRVEPFAHPKLAVLLLPRVSLVVGIGGSYDLLRLPDPRDSMLGGSGMQGQNEALWLNAMRGSTFQVTPSSASGAAAPSDEVVDVGSDIASLLFLPSLMVWSNCATNLGHNTSNERLPGATSPRP